MRETIKIENRRLAGIPVLDVQPLFATEAPTLLYYHGWGSNKDENRFIATLFAYHGFRVVVPDAPLHGERGRLPQYYSAEGYEHFWEVITNAVEEADELIASMIEQKVADSRKITVVGSSMGGFVASGVFANDPMIKCLVNFNGAPAWEVSEHTFRKWEGRPEAQEHELVDIRKFDPMNKLDQLYPRPILLMHGERDSAVPIEGQHAFYQAALPYYVDASERLLLKVVPKLDHYVTTGMLEEAIEWLHVHLYGGVSG